MRFARPVLTTETAPDTLAILVLSLGNRHSLSARLTAQKTLLSLGRAAIIPLLESIHLCDDRALDLRLMTLKLILEELDSLPVDERARLETSLLRLKDIRQKFFGYTPEDVMNAMPRMPEKYEE